MEYIDLGLPSGTLWADRNVGANAPGDYGGYLDWKEAMKLPVTLPTLEQIHELKDNCDSVWLIRYGQTGRLFIGPNGNFIFLPAAGYYEDYVLKDEVSHGYYWSGTCEEDFPDVAYSLAFSSVSMFSYDDHSDNMQSVRAVKNL